MQDDFIPKFEDYFGLPAAKRSASGAMPVPLRLSEGIPSGRKLLSCAHGIPQLSYLLVEPYTLSWLALKLSEGAVAALGAQVFNEVFGTGSDIATMQRDTLNRIATIIREAIHEDAVRRCQARIESITSLMHHYTNAPETSLDRLYQATSSAIELVSECRSLGWKATLPFCSAVGLEVSILQERFQRFNEAGERLNIIETCKLAHKYVFGIAFPAFLQWSNSRFSEIERVDLGYGSYTFLYYFNDEVIYCGFVTQEVAENMRKDHMIRESASAHEQLFGSAWDVALNWREIRQKYE
jgi:hypothetical protein